MSEPSSLRFFSCPLRKPSPSPTSSSSDPTPQAMPNMVRKDRNLWAHNVARDCRTISRNICIKAGSPERVFGAQNSPCRRGDNRGLDSGGRSQLPSRHLPEIRIFRSLSSRGMWDAAPLYKTRLPQAVKLRRRLRGPGVQAGSSLHALSAHYGNMQEEFDFPAPCWDYSAICSHSPHLLRKWKAAATAFPTRLLSLLRPRFLLRIFINSAAIFSPQPPSFHILHEQRSRP